MALILLLVAGCGVPDATDDTKAGDTGDTGAADEPCHPDADLDGYGDAAATAPCRGAAVTDATDCDDAAFAVHPGAPEVCNGRDDDCDARVDDADDDLADGVALWVDADGDGYGGDTSVAACTADSGAVPYGGDCDDTDAATFPGAPESCESVDRDCDGVAAVVRGSGAGCPAASCAEVAGDTGGAAEDGAYFLATPSGAVTPVWCDMTTDGGGWTLGFVRNTASTGSQPDFGAGDVSPSALAASPGAASVASTAALGWLDLNTFDYVELQLAAYGAGAETYRSRSIPRDALRIPFGSDGYYLYGGDAGYWWCGGAATYTDGGVGATDNPPDATAGCNGHGSLGSGWDFSEYPTPNAGLTLCGGDGSSFLSTTWGGGWLGYGAAGGAQAIWVR